MKMDARIAVVGAVALTVSFAIGAPKVIHVPEGMDGVERRISPVAAKSNHILVVNVADAIPSADWPVVVNFTLPRLQLNVWTNAVPTSPYPAVLKDAGLVKRTFGERAKVCVFIEDADEPIPYVSSPCSWCRVNVRYLKADNPDAQTLRDRYAKALIKGLAYACGAGMALDRISATYYDSLTLEKMDKTGIVISPDSYFPMVETLRAVGGDELITPAVVQR